ncbi:MAG: HlyD family efflux transporter periplasmic adaptor subunit [Oscillospiraceae bacterium]
MNNGTLTVVLVLVAIFVIITVVNVGIKAVKQNYVTETALLSVGSDSESVQGVFIRDEKVITYHGNGVISYEVSDGGKLGIGSVIANVYSSETQIEIKQRIATLENELALLERISNPGTTKTAQPSNISELFMQDYKNFLYHREQDDFTELQSQREEMVVLLSTYQLVTGKDAGYTVKMQSLESELEALRNSQEEPLDVIPAEEAAYFVSYADGYENQFSMQMLDSLTPEQLSDVKDNPNNNNGVVGKLINSYQWGLAAVVDNSERIYQTGDMVTLKFASTSEVVKGKVTNVNPSDDPKKSVVVITCDEMTYDLVQHRTENVEIIRADYQGIKVPRSAIHFKTLTDDETGESETVRGVYILNGEQPEFRRLNVVYEGVDYVISAQTKENGYLMLYDSIIRKGIDADGQ